VVGREGAEVDEASDILGKVAELEGVGDGGAAAEDGARDALLREAKLEEAGAGGGLGGGQEGAAAEVGNEGEELGGGLVGEIEDDGREGAVAELLCGAAAELAFEDGPAAGPELEAPDEDGVEGAGELSAVDEAAKGELIERAGRPERGGRDGLDGEVRQGCAAGGGGVEGREEGLDPGAGLVEAARGAGCGTHRRTPVPRHELAGGRASVAWSCGSVK